MSRNLVRGPAVLLALLGWLAAASLSATERILLVARGYADKQPIPGLRFGYQGVTSRATNEGGATELDLPASYPTGRQIKIDLVATPKAKQESWFLVNDLVNIPAAAESAALMLMRGSEMRQIGAEVRGRSAAAADRPGESTAEQQRRALTEAAARHGLSFDQLQKAIDSYAKTPDPKDQGIALYLQGNYSQAVTVLTDVAARKELDFVDTLRYLGASQFAQAKFQDAADTFRKAVALRADDAELLTWHGKALYQLAAWSEAEPLMRRAVALDEKSHGPEHPEVAIHLNNLAQLLQATNRLAEAEPLMRRALAIDEKRLGPEHPEVGIRLNNLAVLLQATNRLAEAEPLMRRALAIDEKSRGPEHPEVGIRLNNLAQLLKATNRLAEAEPLMQRALAIHEKSHGPEHPEVATDLSNLALLFQDTKRLAEAEPLMRRALAIDEKSYGPEHPEVATDLSNLAQLLQAMNRLAEAEPPMRRALALHEEVLEQQERRLVGPVQVVEDRDHRLARRGLHQQAHDRPP